MFDKIYFSMMEVNLFNIYNFLTYTENALKVKIKKYIEKLKNV